MICAPIALFVYNRIDHTKKTVESLQKNLLAEQSELFIFCDDAKNSDAVEAVKAVRSYVKTISGFKEITIIEREKNFGLAASIISGVSEIIEKFGRIIVLEDDMVTSKHFLTFMNEGLDFYESEEKVISIHGYIYPVKSTLPETFFLRGADCWGWATWKRGWDLFEKNGAKLLSELQQKNLTKKFDFDGCYPYARMLEDQVAGKNNSWAIRWYASAFLAEKLTLYPGKSLVQNIGADGSGTHCADMSEFNTEVAQDKILLRKIPILENFQAQEKIKKFFKPRKNLIMKFIRKIKKKLKKRERKKEQYGWFSTNLTWDEAKQITSGYDHREILEKCKNALLKVKNGEAVFERDSVIFDKIEYSWPLLSGLLLVAAKNNGNLSLIDFGGSLGSTYFQNKKFLSQLKEVKWSIVEQENFVDCGKKYFEDSQLKFYHNIESCIAEQQPKAIIFSNVLQYLEKPYDLLAEVAQQKFEYLIFDLTAFHNDDKDLLTIQKVWPEIYQASYPCRFLSKTKFFEKLLDRYELIEEFLSHFGQNIEIDGKQQTQYCGAILKLKKES
jgi:putative methyltransferase (TIGR04325 family)